MRERQNETSAFTPFLRDAWSGGFLDLRSQLFSGAFHWSSLAPSPRLLFTLFRPRGGLSTPVLPILEYCTLSCGFPTPAHNFVTSSFINSPQITHFEHAICFLPGVRLIQDLRALTNLTSILTGPCRSLLGL